MIQKGKDLSHTGAENVNVNHVKMRFARYNSKKSNKIQTRLKKSSDQWKFGLMMVKK
jgi:hypothetical protein